MMREKVIRVAIVGAGAGGLCALRHLASQQSPKNPKIRFRAVAFEQALRVGGTWVYTDQIGKDEWGLSVHSSMYKNLRTNLAKECMAFPDFPFPRDLPSFIHHEDVETYLENYTSHFDLWKHIKLQRCVEHVRPVFNKEKQFGVQWEVTTLDVKTNSDKQTDTFDAVLVCNGHYAKPTYPDIPGLNKFQGQMLHSHDYREPSPFKDHTVVILGARSSGQDIAVEVASVAKQVYLCHNNAKLATLLPSNVEQKAGLKHCHATVLEFNDSSALEADSLILCTGYDYTFDFLSKDVGLEVNNHRITPLYKHFLHCQFPNFGIVGVPKTVLPFPLFDVQIQLFRSILDGSCSLPSEQEMRDDAEEDYQQRKSQGLPHRYFHVLADRQFDYNRELARLGQNDPLPNVHEIIYNACQVLRRADIVHYRRNNFILAGNGKFKIEEDRNECNG